MNLTPKISLKSRYSSTNVNNNYFAALNISGNTNVIIGNKSSGNPGYIYAPYIMMESNDIIKMQREKLKEERIKKLNKLKNIYKT